MNNKQHEEARQAAPPSRKRRGFRFYRRKSSQSKKRLKTRNRYEAAHLISEITTALLFLAGSFCLFYPEVKLIGSCLFILGSIQMLVRSLIRMSYMFKMKKWDYLDDKNEEVQNQMMH
ncbi:YrhK family protein [Neobacillus mesonae]|nr:YrhK family protein [Neobacillus mesonae]